MSLFSKIWLVDLSKTVHANLFARNRKLHTNKSATTNSNLATIDYSDMHNRKTYMYMHISFKQNGVSRSFKTVHTNVFAKKS